MTGEWKTMQLDDRMAATMEYRGKIPTKTIHGVPLVTAKVIKGGRIKTPDEFIAKSDYESWMRRAMPKRGDMVMMTKAPLGEVAQLDGSKIALAQRVITLRGKPDLPDNTFLKFLMQSAEVQEELRSCAARTTVLGIRQSEIHKVDLPLPPPAEQKRIAPILGTLDDKIELNRRMNATLKETAQALFQSWFVDFDPVKRSADGRAQRPEDSLFPSSFKDSEMGEIPKGWRTAQIVEMCEINGWTLGKKDELSELECVEISEVNRGDIANITIYMRGDEPSRVRRRLRHGDTVLPTVWPDRGSYFLALNPPEKRVASTGFAVLTPTKVHWSFLHAALTLPNVFEHLGHVADGGAYPAARPEIIGVMQVAAPSDPQILEAFHRICGPLFEQAEANCKQSRTLAMMRDTLLPQLLSGELNVSEHSQ